MAASADRLLLKSLLAELVEVDDFAAFFVFFASGKELIQRKIRVGQAILPLFYAMKIKAVRAY
ncbi:MAG: hypothetical protein P4M15_11555 [Alphaproteobacteria bacterium]|nr:hypothetical protein [Alphaproteobacteria bacterium]